MKIINSIDSKLDNVTKHIIEDATFGKNEVSVIRKNDKIIFCLPTQTNCKIGCTFCHLTGTTRQSKNLSCDWLVSVVELLYDIEYLNIYKNDLLISYMGVGEPLLNLLGLTSSIEMLSLKYDNIRFGVSTMIPSIKSIDTFTGWANIYKHINIKLHLSVHGITNRNKIVKSDLSAFDVINKAKFYNKLTGNKIEYHYTLVNGVNDNISELNTFSALVACKNKPSTVKFLTLSETGNCSKTKLHQDLLLSLFQNNIVEFYDPPGRDIGSSCGMFDITIYNN